MASTSSSCSSSRCVFVPSSSSKKGLHSFYPKSHPSSSMGLLRSSSSSPFRPRKLSVISSASQTSSSEGASGEEKKERMKRVLSGVQPTGSIHLGNYFGAIQNYVKLQDEHEAFYCVVDLHAITAGGHSPKELEESTRKSAAIYLAAGVSPEKASVFKMIQFKEKARKQGEDVSVGLLDYPVLMAADILLYNADLVPVGEDQRQHLELTRDIAGRFNNLYGGNKWKKRGKNEKSPSGRFRGKDVLIVPEAFTPKSGGRVMSLTDGSAKMSKSNPAEGSRINVLDSPDVIAQKIKRCKTDAIEGMNYDDERPEAKNLLTMYELCTGMSREEVLNECASMRWGEFKPALTEVVVDHLKPIQEKYEEIMNEEGYLDSVLEQGAVRANEVAEKTCADVRDAMGFVHRKSRYM
ncbi:unnamed protein product [Bathycoccus prasinos]